jgi:hypothetical protein|tara:strand:- start:679 stop:819 length:141 start_codon:yes stop_codon:yes gene_type:complete
MAWTISSLAKTSCWARVASMVPVLPLKLIKAALMSSCCAAKRGSVL